MSSTWTSQPGHQPQGRRGAADAAQRFLMAVAVHARTSAAAADSCRSQRPAVDLPSQPAVGQVGGGGDPLGIRAGQQLGPLVGQRQQAARLQAKERRAVGQPPSQPAPAAESDRGPRQEPLLISGRPQQIRLGQLDGVAGPLQHRTAARPIAGSL